MEVLSNISALPRTLAEFQLWEPNDGYKYEWNDGELIKFTGMNKKQIKIYDILLELFFQKGYKKIGTFVAEYDVQLTGIQMRRPDISFLSKTQLDEASKGGDPVPEFMIEVISESDNINKVLAKIGEYYKFGAKVVWLIFPEEKQVHVYTSRRDVKICIENDICSAAPVLPEFEISIEALFAE
ncbi:MAG: Uma2 family endonuclease [Runella slithyformis]|nr:MAG: Uma2 family endonuclease [Runella slithyformis]